MSRRRATEVAILAFWLLMTGLLLRREHVDTLPLATVGGDAAAPNATLLGIFLQDGRRIGHVQANQAPERRHDVDGQLASVNARLALEVQGLPTDLRLDLAFWQSPELAEIELRAASRDDALVFAGTFRDGMLRGTAEAAGERRDVELPIDRNLLPGSGLGTPLRFPACVEGQNFRVATFDPLTLGASTALVRCGELAPRKIAGREVELRRLTVESGGVQVTAFVDGDGAVLRTETPLGLTLEVIDPRELLRPPAGDGPALPLVQALRPQGLPPVRGVRRLRLRLEGGGAIPRDAFQAPDADGNWLLDAGGGLTAAETGDPGVWLGAEPLVQSDDPRIVERARAIVANERDPERQAVLLHDWVFAYIDKESVLGLPSALEVLERRRGDCNEHTVLYVALARAVGLPSRVAIGLVWSDENAGFFYHAWPEVLIGNGWRRLDPTLDQPEADATHLKLLNGGIAEWPRVLPFLGRLQIRVLATGGQERP
jgi:hypothetical protein